MKKIKSRDYATLVYRYMDDIGIGGYNLWLNGTREEGVKDILDFIDLAIVSKENELEGCEEGIEFLKRFNSFMENTENLREEELFTLRYEIGPDKFEVVSAGYMPEALEKSLEHIKNNWPEAREYKSEEEEREEMNYSKARELEGKSLRKRIDFLSSRLSKQDELFFSCLDMVQNDILIY